MGLNNIFANANYMQQPVVKWCFRVEFYKDPDSVVDSMSVIGGVDINGKAYASQSNITNKQLILADGGADLSNAVKKISFPSPTINSVDVHFMGFVKSLPSVITQNGELEITFHDDGATRIFGLLRNMFPKYHKNYDGTMQYMDELNVSLYTIKLYVYDYNTVNQYNSQQGDTFLDSESGERSLLYRYEFKKCWMSELNHGNEFSHDSEDISEIICKFKYSYVDRNSNSLYKMYQQMEVDAWNAEYEQIQQDIAEQNAKWEAEKAQEQQRMQEEIAKEQEILNENTINSEIANEQTDAGYNSALKANAESNAKEQEEIARNSAFARSQSEGNAEEAYKNAKAKAEDDFRRSIGNGNTQEYDADSVGGGVLTEYGQNSVNYNKYWQQKLV
ncbi:MAG: hypothetical protein MJZ34_11385, partial [Paludibacteraceae bacterium]|nr:hypothetical protein [Paludibacteraceae bacterium]